MMNEFVDINTSYSVNVVDFATFFTWLGTERRGAEHKRCTYSYNGNLNNAHSGKGRHLRHCKCMASYTKHIIMVIFQNFKGP